MDLSLNNLTTFERIRLFVNDAFDKNLQFTTNSLQAYLRTCTHCTIRGYLLKLQAVGFIERTTNKKYSAKALIPSSYTYKSLTLAYLAQVPTTCKPRTALNQGVFDRLKAYLIELPKLKPLDEVFDLNEVRVAVNPGNISRVNLKISNYLSMLKYTGYISKCGVKQYQLLKPIPYDFSSFKLQYEYDNM